MCRCKGGRFYAKTTSKRRGQHQKTQDGRWEGRYTIGHDSETGKAIIKNVLGKTQTEVKEKLKRAIEENVGIDYGRAKTYTVGSWLEMWLENYAKVKLRPSTFKTSQGFLENHIKPHIGSTPLAELTFYRKWHYLNNLKSRRKAAFHYYGSDAVVLCCLRRSYRSSRRLPP